ncbi:hypothetical protein ABW19_dt0205449 [Dactylella cylindrospora]|nr:hypothetical protein ABW19_dt0205449 [Dactylella cylindrospora]
MSTLAKPPPLPSRTSSTLSVPPAVPLDKAIETLSSAAAELQEDPVTFTTVLDLHTSTAYNRYTFADQNTFLQSIEELFEKHSELASDIAWDAVPMFLKFASRQVHRESKDAEAQKAVVMRANSLLDYCGNNGNSKEVFLVVAEKIKLLDFRRSGDDSDFEDGEDEEEDEGNEDIASKPRISGVSLSTAKTLLRLQALVQKRMRMKTPSRFLATSLMSLLSMTTKAARSLPIGPLCDVMNLIIEFVASITPTNIESPSDADVPIQIKLIQAFITHGIEAFLTLPADSVTTPGWASAWDKKVRPEKVVPKNLAAGHSHHNHAASVPDDAQTKVAVGEVLVAFLTLSDMVGMDMDMLLKNCLEAKFDPEEEPDETEEPGSPTAPTSAEEIPLSYVGCLLLFAGKLNRKVLKDDDPSELSIRIFPDHATLSSKFLPEGAEGAVVDALVFIGSWIIRRSNKDGDLSELGKIPSKDDDFFLYLQKYSALSAQSSEPDLRALCFLHATTILHLNPREDLRLAFVKDTLEHCPFESLKAAIIGYLKDETLAALKEKASNSNKSSIFLSPIIVDTLLLELFPDYEEEFLKSPVQDAWVHFNESYSTISATANFYYLLWANDDLRNDLGVMNPQWITEIQRRWVDVIKKSVEKFKKVGKEGGVDAGLSVCVTLPQSKFRCCRKLTIDSVLQKEIQDSAMDLEMLSYLLDRLDEIRQQKSS